MGSSNPSWPLTAESGGLDDTLPAVEGDPGGAAVRSRSPSLPPGPPGDPPLSDRYRLGTELGRGGMGRVVEAFDVQLGRSVALKEALPRGGTGTYKRFAREIQITARLEHASIVPLYDSGTTPDGRPYYVMRRVSGRPLEEAVGRARDLGERLTLLPALKAAIDAIGHAHKRGVVHRDLKPANILVGDLGETVVIDWGLAKVIGEEDDATRDSIPADVHLQTQIGAVFGTPGFMAPEQARGEDVTPRGDVYALGATMYHLLSAVPPHGGKSATEVIDSNRRAAIRPIEEVAPGVPRELVAIVRKSMAAAPADRYADAAAFAEDVRRFLDGQLVAAHRYTRRQRLWRFARRHRAPLVIAAFAAVAVAALSWLNVHRVLEERAAAVEGQRLAEERAEALIVERARALVDENPTKALAALKALRPGSSHEAEARAVAKAAAARGIPWGVSDAGITGDVLFPRLSPDGTRLLVRTQQGSVRVYDTERHVALLEHTYAAAVDAIWIGGGGGGGAGSGGGGGGPGAQLLVWERDRPPFILDPVTGGSTPTVLPPITDAVSDERGDRVVVIGDGSGRDRVASLFEPRTGKVTPLASAAAGGGAAAGSGAGSGAGTGATSPPRIQEVAIAADGSWAAVMSADAVTIYDRDGHAIAGKEIHAIIRVLDGGGHHLVVQGFQAVWELDAERLTWTEIPTGMVGNEMLMMMAFRGHTLTSLASSGVVREWSGTHWYERLRLDSEVSLLTPVGDDLLVVATAQGVIEWISSASTGHVTVPALISNGMTRLSGARDRAALAVTGDDLVLVYDLAAVAPSRIPTHVEGGQELAVLNDAEAMLLASPLQWVFVDLMDGRRFEISLPEPGLASTLDVLPDENRALVETGTSTVHLVELVPADPPPPAPAGEGSGTAPPYAGPMRMREVARARVPGGTLTMPFAAKLVPGGGVVLATTSVVRGAPGGAAPRDLAQLDGEVADLTAVASDVYAAVSSHGEVVRGSLATGALARARVPTNAELRIAAWEGQVAIASGQQLFLWSGSGEPIEIARFTQPVRRLREVAGGIAAVLADGRVLDVARDAATGAWTPSEILPRGSLAAVVADHGHLVLSRGSAGVINLVDLPARVRWTVPDVLGPQGTLEVTPTSGELVVETGDLRTWRLPRVEGDLHAWLDRATNAVEDADGDLSWPWQKPAPP